ncbi:Protein of unknown function [Bacillus thuringiensis]|uniref:Uncharacterized protein n=1 Tax=Bacillus thuringiensis TaxID=1428 RepID=A0A1C4DVL4_BACTU|nr:Protein of unknown function [Bacillus thuringiensis]
MNQLLFFKDIDEKEM